VLLTICHIPWRRRRHGQTRIHQRIAVACSWVNVSAATGTPSRLRAFSKNLSSLFFAEPHETVTLPSQLPFSKNSCFLESTFALLSGPVAAQNAYNLELEELIPGVFQVFPTPFRPLLGHEGRCQSQAFERLASTRV
jgi:hypothetical protein